MHQYPLPSWPLRCKSMHRILIPIQDPPTRSQGDCISASERVGRFRWAVNPATKHCTYHNTMMVHPLPSTPYPPEFVLVGPSSSMMGTPAASHRRLGPLSRLGWPGSSGSGRERRHQRPIRPSSSRPHRTLLQPMRPKLREFSVTLALLLPLLVRICP